MALTSVALVLLAGCGSPSSPATKADGKPTPTSSTPAALNAGYAAEFGGLDTLVAAAKKEGRLNVIGLASDWANYGDLLARFQSRYGIAVTSRQPSASSREELDAARELRGTGRAPDVFDLSVGVAAASAARFGPYKVTTWGDIPDAAKDPAGRYVGGYGGVMSIGYDAKKVPAPRTMVDLLKPVYRGKVAINGDPTRASAALHAVVLAALGNGGSAANIGPGVDFFARLKQDGNLLAGTPSTTTIAAGQTPVVVDWDFTNVQRGATLRSDVDWRVVVPQQAVVGSYYVQAINIDAPHPAAARLWQEFLYSDEGQNLWLASLVRPVRADAMASSGSLDQSTFARLPRPPGRVVVLTPQQLDGARKHLEENWAKAIG